MIGMITHTHDIFMKRIQMRQATIGIIGLGYVGLPTAAHYVEKGYPVIGLDVSEEKVKQLQDGKSYIDDISDQQIEAMNARDFEVTTDRMRIHEMDVIFICVPTPVDDVKVPDLRFVISVGETIAEYIQPGTLVILESTTYPGTTESYICQPLQDKGFRIGEDVYVAYSPERVDPGNRFFDVSNTPKVVGGVTPHCTELACEIIGHTAVPVSSVRTAELAKVFENTFRWINIALVNEMAMLCHTLHINVWEMLEAAGTKPYGFMKFQPGIGVGGHCIPVDPYYLTHIMKQQGKTTKMIEVAGEINEQMIFYTYYRLLEIMNTQGRALKDARVIVLGAAYKENIGDLRESPIIDFIHYLQPKVTRIQVIDPYVSGVPMSGITIQQSYTLSELAEADIVIVGTPHDCFDWEEVFHNARLVFDSKNIFRKQGLYAPHILTL